MIQKLLLFVLSLFLKSNSSSSERSFIPSLKLLCLGMFFVASSNYGQCAYPGTANVVGTAYTFCIDGTSTFTTANVNAGNYVLVNVIKGYTYTFTVGDAWTATGTANQENLTIFDASNNLALAAGYNVGQTGTSISNWLSPISGQIKVLLTKDCGTASSGRTLTLTQNTFNNTLDTETFAASDVWRGHIYNFTNVAPPGGSASPATPSNTDPFAAAQYVGYYDVGAETIPTTFNFGGDGACFPVFSNGAQRASIYTEKFAVRYRMKSTRPAGCYFVNIKGDDGVRLYVDNVKVFDEWKEQGASTYGNLLVYLNGNSDLILDYYENAGVNEVSFSITPFSSSPNTVTVPTVTNVCTGTTPAQLDGSSYSYNGSSINKTIKFQWQSAPDNAGAPGTWSNITSATLEDYTPVAITAATVPVITWYRRNVTAAASNASACNYNSNEFAITTSPTTVVGTVSGGTTICAGSQPGDLTLAGNRGNIVKWQRATNTGFTTGLADIAVTTNVLTGATIGSLTTTTYFRAVVQSGGCAAGNSTSTTVTVTPGSVGGSIAGSTSVCSPTNSTALTLSGHTGTIVRWESSTDDFATVINSIANTTATYTATNISVTTSYRAVIQYNSCPIAYSAVGSVVTRNPVATGITICQGGSGYLIASATCAAVAQTPVTASGTGGKSDSLTYGGAGNTDININFPALPVGATVTGTNVIITYNTLGSSFRSELRVMATPPVAVGAAQSDLTPSNAGTGGTVTNASIGTWSTGNPTGNWTFAFRETYDDAGQDANISNITITVSYTLPGTLDWFTVASAGTKIGSGSPFNPVGVVGSGLPDTNTAGTKTYYVACSTDPTCRTKVDFVINPLLTAPTVSTTQPTCSLNTGTITVTAPTGAGITYSIDGTDYTNTTGVFSGLAIGGPYNVTTKNSSGCLSSATPVTLIAPTVKTWTGYTDTKWNLAGNWSPNGIPSASDCVVIPNVTNKPIISGTGVNGFAQVLTVDNNASLTVFSSNTLTVTDGITVGTTGSLVFENHSSLLQTNNSPTINTGSITYKRISPQIRVADFTYWSTPVSPQTLFDVSPETLFDKYFGFDGDGWVGTNSSTTMTVGKGYIIRGPQSYSRTVKADYPASFIGVPNNGNLTGEPLAANKYYLLGNPYPSALNAKKLLDANLFLNGTLYFWTHNTAVVFSPTYQYNSDDYAVYNITGGTATYAAPSGSIPGNSNNNKPSGMIAAGQSFFASTNAAGTVAFDNSMRFGATDNTMFFKSDKTSTEATNRIWLNITNDGGAFKQLLVGYVEGATNGVDTRYDGLSFDANPYLDFYSINNDNKFAIQGRALPFTNSDIVPLGYRTTIEGEFTIAIDEVDGGLSDQDVYLEDKSTGKIHDLRAGNYTFTTAIGTFTDRFVLRYANNTLGVGDVDTLGNDVLVSVKDKVIKVTSSKEDLKQVTIFDISGKLIYNKSKVGETELVLKNLTVSDQVLLVKVILENGHTTTKKIIFK